MKVYNHINDFSRLKNAVVTIGTFDGVHIGHQKIIDRLKEKAQKTGGETVILTFFPHPRMILHPEDSSLKMLTTIPEKIELLEKAGIDHVIITPFTRDFSNLSPLEYVEQVLVNQIGTKHIVVGYDHRFGKDRQGSFEDLEVFGKQFGFDVEEITEQEKNEVIVSSTRIRNALQKSDVKTASEFLGYHFHLTGKVIKGDQIGRKLGFPTANLFVEETYKLIPADGVYAVKVDIFDPKSMTPAKGSSNLKGMGYIGHRPTINGMTHNIEVNLFNFSEDIYGRMIRFHFYDFIRGDLKFNNLDELKEQLKIDMQTTLNLLG
ncbi:bifunctional riboflavin kinase/FAD synthetase [Pedobacter sp. HMF7647]|uniref:Riboflavin biosynthesis protein n=1 Tax=Hufsiella arboris TaxID=2695275 RepID=A0A7K1Y8P0_9SPHI|nr:bifunctional riboflavin kinase/FAD synthetase [Hufsiella arboris]MXV50790.1 bifunctional riboflavin kinase/FAD synthetase [Hufsiella arboris]